VGTDAPAGPGAYAIAVDPLRRFAFVANRDGSSISTYAIDPADGSLTSLGTATSTIQSPVAVAVHPSGNFLFVAGSMSGNGVASYRIDATTGALTATGALTQGGGQYYQMVLEPSGRFLYSLVDSTTTGRSIYVNAVDPSTGKLTYEGSVPVTWPDSLKTLTADPTGRFLFQGTNQSYVVSYAIDQESGWLAMADVVPVGNIQLSNALVDPSGRFIYAMGRQDTLTGAAYTIDAATGALEFGSMFTHAGSATYMGFEPSGEYAYLVMGGTIQAFTIDPSTGALTLVNGGATSVSPVTQSGSTMPVPMAFTYVVQ
jgi:6-phosphogluconolactonase (cycloisomerase 2 family)